MLEPSLSFCPRGFSQFDQLNIIQEQLGAMPKKTLFNLDENPDK
jgi:hypothetical protein